MAHGEHIVWQKVRTFNSETRKYEEEWIPQGASFLRTGIELGRETSRDSGNQIVFVEGGNFFLLRRRPYDNTFKRPQYSPDPSEPERSWPACAPGGTLWESGVDWTAGRAKGWAKFNGWDCAAFPPSPVPEPRG